MFNSVNHLPTPGIPMFLDYGHVTAYPAARARTGPCELADVLSGERTTWCNSAPRTRRHSWPRSIFTMVAPHRAAFVQRRTQELVHL